MRSLLTIKQECIPVGCVLPTAVAIGWGGAGPDPRKQAPPRSRHPAQEEAPSRAPQGGTPQEQAPPREQGPPEQATPPLNRILDTRL